MVNPPRSQLILPRLAGPQGGPRERLNRPTPIGTFDAIQSSMTFFRAVFGISRPLLDFAFELIAAPVDDIQVIVGKFPPCSP